MRTTLTLFVILLCFAAQSRPIVEDDTLVTATGNIYGTLTKSDTKMGNVVALIIAGSGPTDRDGNNLMMKNNSLLMLSDSLVAKGIATLRYDKRGIAKSAAAGGKESDLRFENYINDAVDWIKWLRQQRQYGKVIIIGHSEGSLIGMVAAQIVGADGYISIAGAGFSADKILKKQLRAQAPALADDADKLLDSLAMGMTVTKVDPKLLAVFRPSVQPYIISWFKYDPFKEIGKLKIPVLLIQGNTDIQVSLDDAMSLSKACPTAKLVVIDHMNHIFKSSGASREENLPTYTNATLPIVKQLPDEIVSFIASIARK